jgi:hypothetical protein
MESNANLDEGDDEKMLKKINKFYPNDLEFGTLVFLVIKNKT